MGINIIIMSINKYKYKEHTKVYMVGPFDLHPWNSSLTHYVYEILHDFLYNINKTLLKVIYGE